VLDSADPRKAMDNMGAMHRSSVETNASSHEKARVALQEEDVVEEVEAEGSKVEEGSYETPVLRYNQYESVEGV
jgi:hypothetical protein